MGKFSAAKGRNASLKRPSSGGGGASRSIRCARPLLRHSNRFVLEAHTTIPWILINPPHSQEPAEILKRQPRAATDD